MAEPMKIRAQMQGDIADVKVLMNHPMDVARTDSATGKEIPAHFIKNVTATLNGGTVLQAQWGQSVSRNPFLGFKVKGAKAGDKIVVSWEDNTNDQNSIEVTVS